LKIAVFLGTSSVFSSCKDRFCRESRLVLSFLSARKADQKKGFQHLVVVVVVVLVVLVVVVGTRVKKRF
jgi:hypothetical protein